MSELRETIARIIEHRVDQAGYADKAAADILALPQLASVGRDSSSQSQPCVAREPISRADTEADDTGWRRADKLLYTLAATGQYRHGEPVLANRFMVDVSWDRRYATDDEGEALIAALADFLVRPLPNTPLSAGKEGC